MPNLVSQTCPSFQILGKHFKILGISDFRISGKSLINENCRNSRISHHIDMNLGPVTCERTQQRQKNWGWSNVGKLWSHCLFSDLWPICSLPEDPWSIKLTFSLRVTLQKLKTELTQLFHYCFEERYYFCQKMKIFCKKMLTSAELGVLILNGDFLKLYISVYFGTEFQVFSIA